MAKKLKYQKFFERLGIDFYDEEYEGNYIADCPFSGKEKKLYVNLETGQWDSKVAGVSGNHYMFMRQFYDWCAGCTSEAELVELGINKSLPVVALEGFVVRNPLDGKFIIPEFSKEGKITGLGSYYVGSKGVFRLPLTNVQCNGAHTVKEGDTVYIAEGEWDYITLRWAIEEIGSASKVVCLPGAGTFKQDWAEYFKGCDVKCCYDNDKAGREGEKKAYKLLKNVAKSIRFRSWEPELKDGFDVRDLFVSILKKRKSKSVIKSAFMKLNGKFNNELNAELRGEDVEEVKPTGGEEPNEAQDEKELPPTPSAADMEEVIGKHLKMESYIPLDVMYGTCFANRIDGDPVWMFLIAPPGGSKTELLMTLNKSEHVETTTTLTAPALISGIKFEEGNDPSLLVKVNNKMLSIKDFTTILSMPVQSREEVFGVLRDVYDGYVEKYFGTGVKKSYKSKFGILAGVTPVIDALSAQHASLGERFLKLRLDRFEHPELEEFKIIKALGNVGAETGMRREMQLFAKSLLRKPIPKVIPPLPDKHLHELTHLAMLVAHLRGAVTKDPYSQEMLCMPVREAGTRLAKQMSKLGKGICVYRDFSEINEYVMKVLRYVAIDTCPDRTYEIVKYLWRVTKGNNNAVVTQADIVENTGMTQATISRVCENMVIMNLLKKVKAEGDFKVYLRLSNKIMDLIVKSKVSITFDEAEEDEKKKHKNAD